MATCRQQSKGMAEPTIHDVARLAKVSIASVSRALNNLGNVTEKTRLKVEDAVRELGYVPHAGARSLSLARTRGLARTRAIGVILPDVHGEFFSEIMRGMDREASRRGYVLLLSNMHGSACAMDIFRAMRGRVDGLVVMAPHLDADEVEDALPLRLPAVLLNANGRVRSHNSFGIDNAHGVRSIIDHLRAIGRRRIVHISGPDDNVDAQQRRNAFCRTMRDAAPDEDPIIFPGDYSEESGAATVRHLLGERISFDALFAANDIMAIGAIGALRSASLDVPRDVAIAGFDDVPLAHYLGLTTARVRIDELGAGATARLINMIEGCEDEIVQQLHAPKLIIRASTRTA